MVIKYELPLDDYLEFNRFHTSNSATLRRRKYFGTFVLFVASFSVKWITGHPPELGIAFSAFIAVLCLLASWFGYSFLMARAQARIARQMYQEGSNKAILGPRVVEIDETALVSRAEFFETRYFWKGVDRIVETPDHAFLYVASLAAMIVPKRRMESGDPLQFIDQAVEYWLAANPDKIVDKPGCDVNHP